MYAVNIRLVLFRFRLPATSYVRNLTVIIFYLYFHYIFQPNCITALFVAYRNSNLEEYIGQMRHVYGDVYTIWLGHQPLVIITHPEIASKVFSNGNCASRGQHTMSKWSIVENNNWYIFLTLDNLLSNGTNLSVFAMDHSKDQQAMRQIFQTSTKLLSTNQRAAKMITEYLDPMVSNLKLDKNPFDPFKLSKSFLTDVRIEQFFGER